MIRRAVSALPSVALPLILLVLSGSIKSASASGASEADADDSIAIEAELTEAIGIYQRIAAERLVLATDPNERIAGNTQMLEKLISENRYEDLFLLGDEAFEQEASDTLGAGMGQRSSQADMPPASKRVQYGELGGLDSGSCRSCHFAGGPDGGGSATQLAFFRGDGDSTSSAITRDPPHVMGLGYLQIAAQQIERQLIAIASSARQAAEQSGHVVENPLIADGIDFGTIRALPDGDFDRSDVVGISPDLRVRPFGHKGRYHDLVMLADDGLQQHFGIQSPARVDRHKDNPQLQLGAGAEWDRDDDGMEHEVPAEHAVLLATYLAMLPIPEMRMPVDPRLQQAWTQGQQVFDDVGCAACHRPSMQLQTMNIRLSDKPEIDLDLAELGREPRPRKTDVSPDDTGVIARGVPIYAYTDFKRHDLGDDLADAVDEVLPGSAGWTVSRREWLTRPLWGVADTPPYMHDGRAPTLQVAIELHGGDAAASSRAFRNLPTAKQRTLLVFLNSMTRHGTLLVE